MTAALTGNFPAEDLQDLDHIPRSKDRDWRHYTKTSIWRAVTVSGIPFSASLSVIP